MDQPIAVQPQNEVTQMMPSVQTHETGPVAIPIGQMSVLEDLARQLDEVIRTAKNMPLSSSSLIDKKEVLALIETLQRSIPEEIARARAIIRDRDEIIARAEEQVQQMLARAKAQREHLLSRTEIAQAASREAERAVAEAEAVARRIQQEAETYVEGKLATFEVVLQKTLAAVERGRAKLAGSIEADELARDEGDLDS
ncbi:MAG TPA: hypothetical protein VGB83_13060 [Actinomycetota bacterium]